MIVLYTSLLVLLGGARFLTRRRANSLERKYSAVLKQTNTLLRDPLPREGNSGRTDPYLQAMPMKPSEYIRRNFFATTAGACQGEALVCAIAALGADRIMFSVDYPLEDSMEAARFIEGAPISEEEREMICWRNAARLLGLGDSRQL